MLVHLVSCWFTSTAPDHDPLRVPSQGLVHRRFGWLGRLHDPHASGEYRDLEFASGDRNFDENLLDILITSRTDRKSVWIFEAGVSLGTTSAPSQPKGDGNQCCSAQIFGISECFVIFCACDRFRHTRVTGCLHSSTQEEKTAVRYSGDRQQPSEWSSLVAVREATAGAVQALVVMAGFVLFGLGWAALAEASQSFSQSAPTRVHSRAHQLDPDSLTRYREETRIASPMDCREIRHAQIERHTSRYTSSTPFTQQDGCPG